MRKSLEWVMLTYRLPREPSTPRIAVWRRLRGLGVAKLADGLVALPADPRTREQMEWVAETVRQSGGTAWTWRAYLTSVLQERELIATLAAARATEYDAVCEVARAAASTEGAERERALRSLRAQLRRIRRRDFFPPHEQDAAVAAVEALSADGADRPDRADGADALELPTPSTGTLT